MSSIPANGAGLQYFLLVRGPVVCAEWVDFAGEFKHGECLGEKRRVELALS